MKHPFLFASLATVSVLLCSSACSSAKKVQTQTQIQTQTNVQTQTQSQTQAQSDYEYRRWLESQNQQNSTQISTSHSVSVQGESPYKQRPKRTLRVEEQCITMALEPSACWRSYGTATSYVEKAAMAEAERDARNRLAQMLRVSVQGAAQDYTMNANVDLNKTAETIGEEVMTQYVMADLKNTRILKQSIYDLSDGSVQVYVCIEMNKTADEMEKKLENGLERSGVIRAREDRERFLNKMQAGMDEYKARLGAEAEAEGL